MIYRLLYYTLAVICVPFLVIGTVIGMPIYAGLAWFHGEQDPWQFARDVVRAQVRFFLPHP